MTTVQHIRINIPPGYIPLCMWYSQGENKEEKIKYAPGVDLIGKQCWRLADSKKYKPDGGLVNPISKIR